MGNLLWRSLVRGAYKAAGLDSPYSSQEYGTNWSKQRRRCLERDGYECRVCGTEQTDLDRELSVHHITPRSEFDHTNWREINALENLISVCPSCHGTVEGEFQDCSPGEFAEKARQNNI